MNYVSNAQMLIDVQLLAHRVPRDLKGVVGIPRSGMIPASLLATMLHLPLGDLHGMMKEGKRKAKGGSGKYLVVDDSVNTGNSMSDARKLLGDQAKECLFGALYVSQSFRGLIDFQVRRVTTPRLFEWNMFNHTRMGQAMSDIDGIFCIDPPMRDNDQKEYTDYLATATPHYRCVRVPVHTLITNRLERWRGITEVWLKGQGIRFGKLVMCQEPTAEARRRNVDKGAWKGEMLRLSRCHFLIESDSTQAARAAKVSGKPVICPKDGNVY